MYNRAPLVLRLLAVVTAGAFTLLGAQSTAAAPLRRAATSARSVAPPADAQASEYDVKAAYIFNLLPFTTWPASAFESPGSPFTICVARPDPFGSALEQTFHNERVENRPVVIREIASPAAIRGCHVLFIGAAADENGAIEQAAADSSLLTIGEASQFERRGGMVTFVIELGRVRFDINQTAAAKAHIQFSSKVLQVARKVS